MVLPLLDLYSGAGGAAEGFRQAGFTPFGVDIEPQKRYPFPFLQTDALKYLDWLIEKKNAGIELPWVAIHASPPCQRWTPATRIRQNDHPDLIGPTRERLEEIGLPYVIENTLGAPLREPIMLCGGMFPELRVYRHRLFETSFDIDQPDHPKHTHKITKMGRPPQPDEFMHVVGHFAGVKQARKAMGIDWMVRNELREAIPPAFTEYVGRFLLAHIESGTKP